MVAKLSASWKKYTSWLKKNIPDARDCLASPASKDELATLETAIGIPLPASIREFWGVCGGQTDMDGPGLAAGFVFLSPTDVLREWKSWEKLRTKEGESGLEKLSTHCTSSPTNAIQVQYSVAGWLPLWKERLEGNYIGVDLSPGPEGHAGQVINFGRDEDEKSVLFWDFADLVDWLADEAKAGNLTVEDDEDDEDIQHVAHAFGRVVGILRKLVEAGEIPTGRKPTVTPGAQKLVAKKAPTPTNDNLPDPPAPLIPAAPAMHTSQSQIAFDAVLNSITSTLEGFPDATEATSSLFAEGAPPKYGSTADDPLSVSGIPDDEVLNASGSYALSRLYLKFYRACFEEGRSLRCSLMTLNKVKGQWQHSIQVLTLAQEEAAQQVFIRHDSELRDAIGKAAAAVLPGWKETSLYYTQGDFEFFVLNLPVREQPAPPKELVDAVQRLIAAQEGIGLAVHRVSWRLRVDSKAGDRLFGDFRCYGQPE